MSSYDKCGFISEQRFGPFTCQVKCDSFVFEFGKRTHLFGVERSAGSRALKMMVRGAWKRT